MRGCRNIIKLIQLRNREVSLRVPVWYPKAWISFWHFWFQGKGETALLTAAPALTFLDF